ncbi:alpha/beta hydrolase [Cohnella faecalis]|uniref:Esterase family protein n=1 Tax=Cohnella faecalis TaxID=2315694 RepID=A0A398CPM1_9BACL|nr:alpha/beta hydrolase family protein [Cohnella faecalis]RIE00904.1 esterase family protein [Cohnella faecalis]
MPLFQCDFFSDTLKMATSMTVILPRDPSKFAKEPDGSSSGKYPTLYLLHGLSDDHTIWLRRTSIERYADEFGIAVVMPNVHRGFYTNMKNGFDYWTFVSEEVPSFAQASFPLSARREHNFAAGLSMGGYGALKMALRRPEMFAAGAGFSGALDVVSESLDFLFEKREYERIFGSKAETRGSDDDLFRLAEKLAASDGPVPKLYQCCGTEDFLYEDNLRFLKHIRALGLELLYEEGPGGHEWGYWDAAIRRTLEWLPLPERVGAGPV